MFRALGLPGTTHEGAAQLYRLIAASPVAEASSKPETLEQVRTRLADHVGHRRQAAE
jgi:hypothetical protein